MDLHHRFSIYDSKDTDCVEHDSTCRVDADGDNQQSQGLFVAKASCYFPRGCGFVVVVAAVAMVSRLMTESTWVLAHTPRAHWFDM